MAFDTFKSLKNFKILRLSFSLRSSRSKAHTNGRGRESEELLKGRSGEREGERPL